MYDVTLILVRLQVKQKINKTAKNAAQTANQIKLAKKFADVFHPSSK